MRKIKSSQDQPIVPDTMMHNAPVEMWNIPRLHKLHICGISKQIQDHTGVEQALLAIPNPLILTLVWSSL